MKTTEQLNEKISYEDLNDVHDMLARYLDKVKASLPEETRKEWEEEKDWETFDDGDDDIWY